MSADDVAILRLDGGRIAPALSAQIDAIFFEASGRSFASAEERAAFRERWLGRYLEGGTDVVLLAQHASGAVAGYLVGALEDPAGQQRFADIGYFRAAFRAQCRSHPAHLHINLTPAFRGGGIGARLIAAFAACAAQAGAPGMHVVTSKGARNVRFYTRCGFREIGSTASNGRELVFLGKALQPPGPR
jgi:GNAT superfamily N-acetyltransferase